VLIREARSARFGHSVRVGPPDAVGLGDDAVALRLENLEALTDTALTRLDVDDLLVQLLVRVREILDVDTAAVLMLDADSEMLVARAACGIEDEVRQGVRVPLGTGFAGRIAATKEPVRLDHVDATTVANPLLWEKGIKVMIGVPLLSGDDVLGVLHVGLLSNRSFGDEDISLLQVAADRDRWGHADAGRSRLSG
jgi:sigma-B regulation protein RsbU (phosphoserine phosphatase)